MTDFIGTVMSGLIVLLVVLLIVYFIISNGAFLLVISGFVTVGGVIGYWSGWHATRGPS